MKKTALSLALAGLLTGALTATAEANTVEISGTLFQQAGGTTFDTWKINMLTAGTFKVDLLAYESTSNSTADSVDINGDNEFTYMDPDTYIYLNDGHLDAADMLARCDDSSGNHCPDSSNAQILAATNGSADGSIHIRDSAFIATLAAGNYLYLIGDYSLTPTEAATGINGNDTFRNGGDHADYQITLSSDTMNFAIDSNTITITQVPVPGAIWLFGTALAGLLGANRRKSVKNSSI